MKRLSKALVVLSALMLLLSLLPSYNEAQIYEKILRLHVIAPSDSEEDQALKLKVRDEILEYSRVIGDIKDVEEARGIYGSQLESIKKIAESTVKDEGYDYDVDVCLGYEYYPTRSYESVKLPAGEYLSLRVMIGEAQGQNWWCVLYPPLCISAASADEELVQAGFTPEQMQIITEGERTKYKIKFKILESAAELWHRLFD